MKLIAVKGRNVHLTLLLLFFEVGVPNGTCIIKMRLVSAWRNFRRVLILESTFSGIDHPKKDSFNIQPR